MSFNKRVIEKGFTLIEMLLVMVIITFIILAGSTYLTQKAENLRIDRAAWQIQYILNAALAYYVANGTWPDPNNTWVYVQASNSSALQPNFLPATPMTNPYGTQSYYWISHFTSTYFLTPPNNFQVALYIGLTAKQKSIGNIIAGRIPNGYFYSDGYVYGYVNIPGQDLNNAMAINFAGLYHHGACVPVPTCPTTTAGGGTTTTPQIFTVPVSVSGVNDPTTGNIYPISSFTAFATAPGATPPACPNGTAVACTPINGNAPQSGQYWRVCMQVITEKGDVQTTRTDAWGDKVTLGAFTRCAISNEPAGSTFAVFTH